MIYQFHSDLVLPLFVCADKHLAMKAVGESWMDHLPADNWNTEGIKEAMMLTNIFLLQYKHKCLSHLNTTHMNSFSVRIPWVCNNLQQKLQTVIPFPYLSLWLRGRWRWQGWISQWRQWEGHILSGRLIYRSRSCRWACSCTRCWSACRAIIINLPVCKHVSFQKYPNNLPTSTVHCFTLLTFEKLLRDSCDMYISWYITNTHINT